MEGRVESIALADVSEAPTYNVERADALAGLGLAGDRLVQGATSVAPKRQVTLIEAEAIEAIARESGFELAPKDSRRNICTRGVALNHLVDRDFAVGGAMLRGIELCEPCGTLERLTGMKGLAKALIHRGGLRAEVLAGGVVAVGDRVEAR